MSADEILASLPFPVEVTTGVATPEVFEKLRAAGKESGFLPVVLGGEDDAAMLGENLAASNEDASAILSRAALLDVKAWIERRRQDDPEYYAVTSGAWPMRTTPVDGMLAHLDIVTRAPRPKVFVAQVPVENPWDVPAVLKVGGWNECPGPEVHAAMFKKWFTDHGAVVVSVTGDTIEFRVERPPATRDDALRLANEHFVYCPDIVHQGAETLNNLAATLLDSPYWFFWWD